MKIANRKEYLLTQKESGKAIFGVFPAQYPKEILWALNAVPAEIWDPPMEVSSANAHLQSYICSVVRMGMELVLQGKCDFLDGFLFPHTCDSIQNLASVINDYMGPDMPCYFFYHPKAPYSRGARTYYLAQLKELTERLEGQLGRLDQNRLKQAIESSNRISRLVRQLYDNRAQGKLKGSSREFYEVVRRGEFLLPSDYISLLEQHIQENSINEPQDQTSVILSGVLPNPPQLLDKLDELGVRVAHDDFLVASRRLLSPEMDTSVDPIEALAQQYFNMPPCSTKGSGIGQRAKLILNLVDKTGARGVIFNIVKFCEPEWFDVPNLQAELREQGIPSLVLDTEINQGLSGQMLTRIEAFVEMIK